MLLNIKAYLFLIFSISIHRSLGYQISFIFSHSESETVLVEYEPSNVTQCNKHYECDRKNYEICRKKVCTCLDYYERNLDNLCVKCPGEGEACTNCCHGSTLFCHNGFCLPCLRRNLGSHECVSQESLVYLTLSQVALATAMIFGILAMITLLYRIVTHPMYMFGRRGQRSSSSGATAGFNRSIFSRASISSMQRAILWRLRDRPPLYNRNTNSNSAESEPPPTPSFVPGEPPPVYDGQEANEVEPVRDLPPTYAVAIISAPHLEMIDNTNSNQTLTIITALANPTVEQLKDEEKKEDSTESQSLS